MSLPVLTDYHSSPYFILLRKSTMKNKAEILMKYELFSSSKRGEKQVEKELASLMKRMTTPSNVRKLESVVEGPLKIPTDQLRFLKEAFKRIDREKKES